MEFVAGGMLIDVVDRRQSMSHYESVCRSNVFFSGWG